MQSGVHLTTFFFQITSQVIKHFDEKLHCNSLCLLSISVDVILLKTLLNKNSQVHSFSMFNFHIVLN